MVVQLAKREQIKVPILLMGASGSGKTLGSLLIAKGMIDEIFPKLSDEEKWAKIGVIDTEHSRSSLYVDTEHNGVRIGQFAQFKLSAPYNSERYLGAFKELKAFGCEVIIIDGISNNWNDEGGVLAQADANGGGMQGWSKVSGEQRNFLKLLTNEEVHVIATVRTKQGIEVTTDDNGKVHVEKVGLKMEQKDSLEYEFAIAFQIYENHIAQATKDNSSIFKHPLKLTDDVGKKIVAWAEKGVDVRAEEKGRIIQAVKAINDLVGNDEARKKELQRQMMARQNAPLENWSLDNLKKLYVIVSKIQPVTTNTTKKDENTEKEGK